MPSIHPARLSFSCAALTASLLLAGCESGPKVADEASVAAAKETPPPVMQAEANFFDGRILVEVNLGRGFRPRLVRRGARARDLGDPNSVRYQESFAREIAEDEAETIFIPRMTSSTLPPVALRLRLSNLGDVPLDVEILDCKSYLGDFAVRPEKITLAAGESGQPDAMVSLLGVSGQQIPVTLTLRVDGKTETQVATLTPVKAAVK
jgi:hypothetical protein